MNTMVKNIICKSMDDDFWGMYSQVQYNEYMMGLITHDHILSHVYATCILQGRFEEGEDVIMANFTRKSYLRYLTNIGMGDTVDMLWIKYPTV